MKRFSMTNEDFEREGGKWRADGMNMIKEERENKEEKIVLITSSGFDQSSLGNEQVSR